MEYTLERFELDMRKVDLYVENAVAAFNITADEASLYSESTEYDLIMTEASDGLGAKIKAAFTKIIESIKKFFAGLVEKIKSIFTKSEETKVKKAVAANPQIGKQKVDIDDIKSIEKWCGKRKILCAKLVKKAKAGTLTQDEFDKTVEQMDAMEAKIKSIGKIAVPVTVALAAFGGGAFVMAQIKKHREEGTTGVSDLNDGDGNTLKVKVAQLWASVCTTTAAAFVKAKTATFGAIKSVLGKLRKKKPSEDKEFDNDTYLDDEVDNRSASLMSPVSTVQMGDDDYNFDSADDLYGFDLTDTFFDI